MRGRNHSGMYKQATRFHLLVKRRKKKKGCKGYEKYFWVY